MCVSERDSKRRQRGKGAPQRSRRIDVLPFPNREIRGLRIHSRSSANEVRYESGDGRSVGEEPQAVFVPRSRFRTLEYEWQVNGA